MDSSSADRKSSPPRVRWKIKLAASLLGGTALLCASAFLLRSFRNEARDKTDQTECKSDRAVRIGANAGVLRRYRLTHKTELCDAKECTSLLELSGELETRARPTQPNGDEAVELVLRSTPASSDVQEHLPSKEALATPMTATFASDGSVIDVAYARPVDAPTKRLLESLLADLQVQTPACASEKLWSAVEKLPLAEVMSHFEKVSQRAISWRRKEVLLWSDADSLFPIKGESPEFTASKHQADIDESGYAQRVSGTDEMTLETGEKEPMRLKISTTVDTLSAVAATQAAPHSLPPASAAFRDPARHSEHADTARIAGHDVKSIVAELKRTKLVGKEDDSRRSRLYVATTALLRRNPGAAKQAAELIRAGHEESEFLRKALGDAGTAESAELLADLLRGSKSAEDAASALFALGRASIAGPGVVDSMAARLSDERLGGTARLMIGALAFRSASGSPETSAKAVDTLVADYSKGSTVLIRADALRGLGNAGSIAGLDAARRAAASTSPVERAAAAQALRRIPSDAADRLLATLMEDPNDFVRRSALDAALYRDPTELLVPVVERLARLDPKATVRREAIRALVRWKEEVSSARETLNWVARNDSEADLRKVAVEGLSRPSGK